MTVSREIMFKSKIRWKLFEQIISKLDNLPGTTLLDSWLRDRWTHEELINWMNNPSCYNVWNLKSKSKTTYPRFTPSSAQKTVKSKIIRKLANGHRLTSGTVFVWLWSNQWICWDERRENEEKWSSFSYLHSWACSDAQSQNFIVFLQTEMISWS